VLEVFPVLPLIANEPLGVGALSYAGAFCIGVVADRDAFPDLDVFTAGVRQALRVLGVSPDPTPVHPGRTLRSLVQPATSDRLQAPATTVPLSLRPLVITEGDGDP
jgi:WS/DGAT C-terminal domain